MGDAVSNEAGVGMHPHGDMGTHVPQELSGLDVTPVTASLASSERERERESYLGDMGEEGVCGVDGLDALEGLGGLEGDSLALSPSQSPTPLSPSSLAYEEEGYLERPAEADAEYPDEDERDRERDAVDDAYAGAQAVAGFFGEPSDRADAEVLRSLATVYEDLSLYLSPPL
ncbi:hypothetical protein KIPB_004029 [Kipferlia bialata]|uniref:Uncharacterized protein n=1 Tax=Kipferlia bialata TaxID=797122 RepID=A0A391NKZ5_9EUKA|nr:hypothetical protein KIPB_004029 [Kipferlia bialata]|eukprot:g4029.t1